jgi:hypothetical protein
MGTVGPPGKVAEAFASAEPAPPLGWLGWLGHIEEAGLLGLTKQRSGTEGERNLLAARAAGTAAARLSEVTFRKINRREDSSYIGLASISPHPQIDHAADRAEEQWTRRVRPFIDKYWPQDYAHKSPALSVAFAELALKTGNEFPSAVAATKNFLMAMRDSNILLYRSGEKCSHLVKTFPDAVLDLLYLTAPQADGAHYGLRKVLDCLLFARPEFRTDRRFQYLERLA